MLKEQLERFLTIVESARRGDEAAKWTLVVAVETERRPAIRKKLRRSGVRHDDLPDAHRQVALRIYESIERLRITPAYFRLEAWIVSGVSRKWRIDYRRLGEPLDVVLTEVEKSSPSKEPLL